MIVDDLQCLAVTAVRFATKVAQNRGKVSDADMSAVKSAGFSDAQIIEIVAVVAENFLTNLLNNVADTDIDFPVVRTASAAVLPDGGVFASQR